MTETDVSVVAPSPTRKEKPPPPKRFAFYNKLSRAKKAEYRRSDALVSLEIPDVYPLRAFLPEIQDALVDVDTKRARVHAQQLVAMLLEQFSVPSVEVRVLKVRPNNDEYELHGLYEHVEGRRPVIRVWAKTAAHKRPVAFKTFVRTLLHEVVHHLDFTVFNLPESFHTHGFYKRESHMVRQLFDVDPEAVQQPDPEGATRTTSTTVDSVVAKLNAVGDESRQLSLFSASDSDEEPAKEG